ncbi:MAG TPA: glutathione S-transferase family protein [Dongiaceae bacterium]|nr:glutathione S-transferase family protein [Dongiaceae bacterium]
MSIILYGASLSPFVRKVRAVLLEKGLPYEHVQIDPFRPPQDYRQLSPFGRIPALKDGDKVLADSGVICAYLDAQYPQTALYPADPYQRAQVQWFEKFGDYELAPVLTFGVFRNRVLMRLMGKPCDDEYVATCLADKFPPLMDYLEAQVPAQGFIVGNQLTVADIGVATHFVNFGHGGETVDAARWPKTAAYVQRILARPSLASSVEQETAVIKKLLSR